MFIMLTWKGGNILNVDSAPHIEESGDSELKNEIWSQGGN